MIYCLWKFEFIITYADALPQFIPLRFVRNFFFIPLWFIISTSPC